MDPYIERAALWPDFHDSLIIYIREALQPQLRPKYAALAQDRLYVLEHSRPILRDISVVRTTASTRGAAVADVAEVDEPIVMELDVEEVRQTLIHIIEPAADNRIVTAIEVLSPDNKSSGEGRRSYLQKRDELIGHGANFVEIDLLRGGQRTRREFPEVDRTWHYAIAVRRGRTREEFYLVPLSERLPRIRIPLGTEDPDVRLDLQAVFTRTWQTGPYPHILNYPDRPPGR